MDSGIPGLPRLATAMGEEAISFESDPLWYKDAVIYQLHVRAFFDSNDDGVGDFKGLTQKLDYIARLGVNTIWLLPFYPSPMRDDGYDIADYLGINPAYGTLEDFQTFVTEAHHRGLKVITELVVNHTSDQHPWFQRARLAERDSTGAQLLRLERHGSKVSGDADHLHGHRGIELGVGQRREAVLLAPVLRASARLEPQQPRRREGSHQRDGAMARSRRRRAAARRDPLSLRPRRHEQREPAGDARGREGNPRRDRRGVSEPHAARRGEPMARGRARVFRRTGTSATWPITSR